MLNFIWKISYEHYNCTPFKVYGVWLIMIDGYDFIKIIYWFTMWLNWLNKMCFTCDVYLEFIVEFALVNTLSCENIQVKILLQKWGKQRSKKNSSLKLSPRLGNHISTESNYLNTC